MPDGYLLLYSIEDLFSAIHLSLDNEEAGAIGLEPVPAAVEIKKDPFAYKSGLECEVCINFIFIYSFIFFLFFKEKINDF